MARVSTYNTDADVSGNDKVLGSDISGATKNYPLKKIGEYFANKSVITTEGQLSFKHIVGLTDRVKGDFWVNSGNSVIELADISRFTISKHMFEESLDVSHMLSTIIATKFVLVEVGNPNIRGEYFVTSSYDYEDDANFIVVDVTAINTNESLTDEAYYVFSNTTTTTADKKYTHEQSSAAPVWTITHNLKKQPAVSVVDSTDNVIICEVEYTSLNQVELRFSTPYSGKAYFN
tara:strand:- start:644 stop:1342 length:699 start_codon:yes stop_codon:yes gene_type:complete